MCHVCDICNYESFNNNFYYHIEIGLYFIYFFYRIYLSEFVIKKSTMSLKFNLSNILGKELMIDITINNSETLTIPKNVTFTSFLVWQ